MIFLNKRKGWYVIFLGIFFLALPKVTNAQKEPNILLIIAEGFDPSFIPPYGNTTIRTPNLSWLAKNGIVFTRMFSTYGVCAPSRTAIITGMYPTSIGAMDQRTMTAHQTVPYLPDYETVPPPEVKCFTEYLRAAGYYCTNHGQTDYQFKCPITAWDENGSKATWSHRKPEQPFFSIVNLNITHESQLWLRQNKPLHINPAQVPVPPYFPQHDSVIRRQVARNYDNITLLDHQIGHLIDELKKDHLLNNTIIIFTCDHNGPFPWYKREVYDRGTHVPFIVYFPDRRRAGTKDTELHSLVDLAPTILSLTHLPIPKYMQGQAFLGTERATPPRKYVYTARDRMDEQYDLIRAVRDKHYQYVRNYEPVPGYHNNAYRLQMPMMQEILQLKAEDSLTEPLKRWFSIKPPEELYDLQKDPYELYNLAKNPAYSGVMQRMRLALNAWERKMQDKGFMQEIDLIKLMWPGLKQPVTLAPVFRVISRQGNEDKIAIICKTKGASIAYHLNSDSPNYWHLYSHPILLSKDVQIQAKAIRLGYKGSSVGFYPNK